MAWKRISLLVIEDDEPALRLMGWGLKEEGFDVFTCGFAAAADAVQEHTPVCVIMNVVTYPTDIVARMRGVVPDIKIVDVGEPPTPTDIDARVTTPITVNDVMAAVNEICTQDPESA